MKVPKVRIIISGVVIFSFVLCSSSNVYSRRVRTLEETRISVNEELENIGYSIDEIAFIVSKIEELFPNLEGLRSLSPEEKISVLKEMILEEIKPERDTYELCDVLRNKRANCLGYSQLFYILGRKVGLDVETIIVPPYNKKRDSFSNTLKTLSDLAGFEVEDVIEISRKRVFHAANLIKLNDNYIILDLSLNYISPTFGLEQIYEKKGVTWIIKGEYIDDINTSYHNIQRVDGKGIYAVRILSGARTEEDFEKVLELNPNSPRAYFCLGDIMFGLKQYEESIKYFNSAVKLYSDFPDAYYHRGIAEFYLGRYEEAIEDFDRARELDSGIADSYYSYIRGEAEFYLGRYEEAIEDFDRTGELGMKDADVYYKSGFA